MSDRRCGTCRFLEVPADKAGRVIARRDYGYRCFAPMPPLPPVPDCLAHEVEWWGSAISHHIRRARMGKDDGGSCPAWERRQR